MALGIVARLDHVGRLWRNVFIAWHRYILEIEVNKTVGRKNNIEEKWRRYMKRADIEKIAKDMEGIGYEILEISSAVFFHKIGDVVKGAYDLRIAPIKDCERARANDSK